MTVRLYAKTVVLGLILSMASVLYSACPEYTKLAGIEGAQANLPDGWCVYGKAKVTGIFRSNIKTFNEQLLASTKGDTAISMDISENGQWIVYVNKKDNSIYIVKSDGSGTKTKITLNYKSKNPKELRWTGFVRKSPFGDEIFFYDQDESFTASYLHAVKVDLSGSSPVVGTQRTLADIAPDGFWTAGITSVTKNQIFGGFREASTLNSVNRFLTIPDNGKGTASSSNFFKYSQPPQEHYWGCGQSMSHDGRFCMSNSAFVGSGKCVPNKNALNNEGELMDHKGFYITRFFYDTDAPFSIDDQIDNPANGVSINWVPERYQVGQFDDVDFTGYSFSNDPKYIIGVCRGAKIAEWGFSYGVWVIDWQSNSWVQVTPKQTSTIYDDPAMYIPGYIDGIQSRKIIRHTTSKRNSYSMYLSGSDNSVPIPQGVSRMAIFTTSGKLIWRSSEVISLKKAVEIPSAISKSGMYIIQCQ